MAYLYKAGILVTLTLPTESLISESAVVAAVNEEFQASRMSLSRRRYRKREFSSMPALIRPIAPLETSEMSSSSREVSEILGPGGALGGLFSWTLSKSMKEWTVGL